MKSAGDGGRWEACWGFFFAAQPDTPAKLAGFAHAVENLEVAAYELFLVLARRAGDRESVEMAESILAEEKAAAQWVAGYWQISMAAS